MKKVLLFLLFGALLVSCSNNSGSKLRQNIIDSTIAQYSLDKYGNNVRTTFVYKIIKDTPVYSETSDKVSWIKDTLYYIPIENQIPDTSKKLKGDTLRKPKYVINWYLLPKDFLLKDYNKKLPLNVN